MKYFISIFVFYFLAGVAVAEPIPDCNAKPLVDFIRSGEDVYLGELHGTVEIPQLLQCLVNVAIKTKRKDRIIVSLELRNEARNLKSDFWRGTDGRSSEAMWSLMKNLLVLEKQGEIQLHFQRDELNISSMGNQNKIEKLMGQAMAKLAIKGQLIALSGNYHSNKEPPFYDVDFTPTGMFVGENVIHIYVLPMSHNSEAWGCVNNRKCGAFQYSKMTIPNAVVDELLNGDELNHDYIFFMNKTTASPPKYQ